MSMSYKSNRTKNKITFKSYSPNINKKLIIHSLKTLNPMKVNLCNNILKINVGSKNKTICLNFDNPKVKKFMLYNLKASKHLNPTRFIPPKQLMANCWFNTMFVTFFFSDKGRKFFRFFRELMITGKKINNEPINENLRKLFFVLNLFIEASYNQYEFAIKKYRKSKGKTIKKTNKKSKSIQKTIKKASSSNKNKIKNLYHQINHLTKNLNTNFFIHHIYQIIKKSKKSVDSQELLENNIRNYDLPNVKDSGNPLHYYETIFKYLNYDILKFMKLELINKIDINGGLNNKFLNYSVVPDIIIIEDFESKNIFDKEYNFKKDEQSYNYVLDSIIITNKDHFDEDANSHFVSVLTINKKEYKFDGSSYSRLSQFKWKSLINKNKDWMFKENPNYHAERYNFTRGYKIMFYYRS